jgi:PAS domain S-box-containing protein
VNPEAQRLLGYSLEELRVLRMGDLTAPLDWRGEEAVFADLIAGKRSSYQLEKSVLRKSREVVRVRGTTFAVPGEDGSIHLVVTMWEDVTQTHRAAKRLQEQAALLDIVPAAVMVLGLDDVVQHWSKGAERLYGWTATEVLGRNADRLLSREAAEELVERRRVIAANGAWEGTVRHVDRAGAAKLVESRVRVLRDEQGAVIARLVANIDVTERRRMEMHVTAAQRMESIGFVAAGAAHDFNNVLAPILMSASLLASETADPRVIELLSGIEGAAQRGAAIVRQLLFFARGEAGYRSLLAVKHIAEATVRLLHETFPRTIEVRCTVPDELAPVEGDATQLSQVLMTLCVHARDAMPDGGTLEICADNVTVEELYCSMHPGLRPGRFISLRVRDTGRGIPREQLTRVFEPYFMTGGLGLSVAYGVVREHGGTLTVTSEEGRGTTFNIMLPVLPEAGLTASKSPVADAPRGAGETVLVVDDEDLIRDLACKVLQHAGYRPITAHNGIEGVAEYARRPGEVAAVLMDINMPQMDGRTAIKILKALDPQARIILATGSLGMEKVSAQEELASFPRLCKPFGRGELLSLLHRVLHA